MSTPDDQSLGDAATFAGQGKPKHPRDDVSLGDERTLAGGDAAGLDTVIDDIEVVDLQSRYRIEGTLGQGGMGAVLLATDTRLGRKVAIKRILGEAARSKTAITRFLAEAKAIAALNHPNIVQIYDYGRAQDGPFLIMEFVDGGSLADRCKQGALPLDEAVDLACQLCDGLAKAHDAGIVHRDIKPANVLLNRDGVPKLTDFGLAKAEASDHGMTMTGAVMGTPDFMPPEQRRDASLVDARSDLWSLAASVYQMVTGSSPRIIRFRDVPKEVEQVLGKALEESKDSRFQTAHKFRDALRSAVCEIRAAGPRITTEILKEGQCKACGTVTSDLTKRFCRNPECGTSLRVMCFKCKSHIPVWDDVCGECGGKQNDFLKEMRETFSQVSSKAEQAIASYCFQEAREMLRPWLDADERLVNVGSRAAVLFQEVEVAEKLANEHRDSCVDAARVYFATHDYDAAVLSLEAIPVGMRSLDSDALLATSKGLVKECESLTKHLETALVEKPTADLGEKVNRALEITGGTGDLGRLAKELEAQERRRSVLLREAKADAAAHALNGDYNNAVDVLEKLGKDFANDVSEASAIYLQREQEAKELLAEIKDEWAANRLKGLSSKIERALSLLPLSEELAAMRCKLERHETEAIDQANAIYRNACTAFQSDAEIQSWAKALRDVQEYLTADQVQFLDRMVESLSREKHLRDAIISAKRYEPITNSELREIATSALGCFEIRKTSPAAKKALSQIYGFLAKRGWSLAEDLGHEAAEALSKLADKPFLGKPEREVVEMLRQVSKEAGITERLQAMCGSGKAHTLKVPKWAKNEELVFFGSISNESAGRAAAPLQRSLVLGYCKNGFVVVPAGRNRSEVILVPYRNIKKVRVRRESRWGHYKFLFVLGASLAVVHVAVMYSLTGKFFTAYGVQLTRFGSMVLFGLVIWDVAWLISLVLGLINGPDYLIDVDAGESVKVSVLEWKEKGLGMKRMIEAAGATGVIDWKT